MNLRALAIPEPVRRALRMLDARERLIVAVLGLGLAIGIVFGLGFAFGYAIVA